MNIEKGIDRIVKATTNNLINGKYKLIEIGEHTSKLEYKGSVLDIWIANGKSHCRIYSKVNGLEFPEFDEEVKKIVYKLATTKTKHMTLVKLKKARKEHKECYLKYKESIKAVRELKAELNPK